MSAQEALRFLAYLRLHPECVKDCQHAPELVGVARKAGYKVAWPDLQEAFRLDWTMRAVRCGFLRPPGKAASREQVRDYFETANSTIVQDVGCTYQAAILPSGSYVASNLFFAGHAGVTDGEHILDAGCGAGGPAVDLAEAFPGLRVTGITLSENQALTARLLVAERGLGGRVQVQVADYHACPFPDGSFDRVLFLESAGYSDQPDRLWREVFRVLRPGGTVFMKEPFLAEYPAVGSPARRQMEAVLAIYRYRMRTVQEISEELAGAGFQDVCYQSLAEHVTTRFFFVDAMNGTAFGRSHQTDLKDLPAIYGFVKGRKPD